MEFLIVIGILWFLGTVFGSSAGKPNSPSHTDKPKRSPSQFSGATRTSEARSSASTPIVHLFDPVQPKEIKVASSSEAPNDTIAVLMASLPKPWQGGTYFARGRALRETPLDRWTNDALVSAATSLGVKKLYHFTDRSNLQSIIDTGGLYSWSLCNELGITIPRPGGSELSRSLDVRRDLQNYVRLGFCQNHPMLYAAKYDGRIRDPIVLEIELGILQDSKILFSDRNATANDAKIGQGADMLQQLRFDLFLKNRWSTEEEKGSIQAEVLVLDLVPGYLIHFEGRRLRNRSPSETARTSKVLAQTR